MRVFVGTFLNPPNQAFYDEFVRDLVVCGAGTLRSIPKRSAHLTYLFSGDVDDEALADMLEAITSTARNHRAVPVSFGLPRVLYAGRNARLVCADVTSGAVEFRCLAEDILAAIALACPRVAASPARAPHVTLARFRRGAARSDAQGVSGWLDARGRAMVPREDRVADVQVVSSQLTTAGPMYEVRGNAEFGT